jgi:pimeloyl-ACP methyl ester carboxylesterase
VLGHPKRPRGRTKVWASRYEAQVGGWPVRYEVAGEGEPVVLVHGLSGSTRWWSRNVSDIAKRYRIYLVDLPGFGKMHRLRRQFVLTEAADWLSEWMNAVGLERTHLVGHSMGGYICLRLAARRPAAVRRLVLVAPAGVPTGRSMVGYIGPLLGAARHGQDLALRYWAGHEAYMPGVRNEEFFVVAADEIHRGFGLGEGADVIFGAPSTARSATAFT